MTERDMTKLCGGKFWGMAACHYLYGGGCSCGLPAKPTVETLSKRVAELEAIVAGKQRRAA